jgi:hypothetical protein
MIGGMDGSVSQGPVGASGDGELRACCRCGRRLPIEQFPLRRKDCPRRRGHCIGCKAAYQREWYARNRERHLANVREIRKQRRIRNRELILAAKDVPCADCGLRYPPYVMDFDHVNGGKRGNIAELHGRLTEEALLAEIAKCEVVCANCHRIRTYGGGRHPERRRRGRDTGSGREARGRYTAAPAATCITHGGVLQSSTRQDHHGAGDFASVAQSG